MSLKRLTKHRNIKILGLPEAARKAENLAKFGEPIEHSDIVFLAGSGLQDAAHRAVSCIGWIWRQWLLGTSRGVISKRVEPFVQRGLEFRRRSRNFDYLPLHDLFLLHCAIFACSDAQLNKVGEQVSDANGDKGGKPSDDGELYVAAWCGMLKYWLLGDTEKSHQQSALIWEASRPEGLLASPKALVTPWLKRDWKGFVKNQQNDFKRLWARARKDHWTVKIDRPGEVVVTTDHYQIEHHWCWAHCGMALLAAREGVDVAVDAFWLPQSAIPTAIAKQKQAL
jgi:hypothetical protein